MMAGGLILALIRARVINPAAILEEGTGPTRANIPKPWTEPDGPECYIPLTGPTVPTRALERLREAAILEASLDNVRFIPCASRLHEGQAPHEAHWHMRCPCGGVVAVCDNRRTALLISDGMQCNTKTCRCNAFHRFGQITWTRI